MKNYLHPRTIGKHHEPAPWLDNGFDGQSARTGSRGTQIIHSGAGRGRACTNVRIANCVGNVMCTPIECPENELFSMRNATQARKIFCSSYSLASKNSSVRQFELIVSAF